jgi:hypothetical protein
LKTAYNGDKPEEHFWKRCVFYSFYRGKLNFFSNTFFRPCWNTTSVQGLPRLLVGLEQDRLKGENFESIVYTFIFFGNCCKNGHQVWSLHSCFLIIFFRVTIWNSNVTPYICNKCVFQEELGDKIKSCLAVVYSFYPCF